MIACGDSAIGERETTSLPLSLNHEAIGTADAQVIARWIFTPTSVSVSVFAVA